MIGDQTPRISNVPPSSSSTATEAFELLAAIGLKPDPWQRLCLEAMLGERENGEWAAPEFCLVTPRQSGKNEVVLDRQLVGMFLLRERLIVHSSHSFATSSEHFRRLLEVIEGAPSLSRRVKRVSRSHGEEGLELAGGQRIRFRTRTATGTRGFTADLVCLDEAQILSESSFGALLPTVSAVPNAQTVFSATAADFELHEHGVVLARLRERAFAGDDRLAYLEWSADREDPDSLTDADVLDRALWRQANPGLGIRISPERIASEQRSMSRRQFAVERLGVARWPSGDGGHQVIDAASWRACVDPESRMLDPIMIAFDVARDRSRASIAAAGWREDGLPHVELIDSAPGVGWVTDRVAELFVSQRARWVVCDGIPAMTSFVVELRTNRRLSLQTPKPADFAPACASFYDRVQQGTLRHLGQHELDVSVAGATRRPFGDASWGFSRRSRTDASPLMASVLALWGLETCPRGPRRVLWTGHEPPTREELDAARAEAAGVIAQVEAMLNG